ncbi:hypothetical protein RSO41_13900 [Halomonas sp. I1]|uniref:hypothetical protein n=1 Tax=Halomonas sp. I1 TaxID=393536 RepID=UPI0028DF1074|nr:hypothetical protein [Halomonas sp. I1]MDT8895746.1 hypothetical protein [Halomonas sp. I1]
MRWIVVLVCIAMGVGTLAIFNFLAQPHSTTLEKSQDFVFGEVVLLDDAGEPADWDKLKEDFLLGPLLVQMNQMLRDEMAHGYASFDTDNQHLTLHLAGTTTTVSFGPGDPVARVESSNIGPIEVAWDKRGLNPKVTAPVMIFGSPSGLEFEIPLLAVDDVSGRVEKQGEIIKQKLSDKAAWRTEMEAFSEKFPVDPAFSGMTQDEMLPGLQATLTYPFDAVTSSSTYSFDVEVTLADQTRVQIVALPPRTAKQKMESLRDDYIDRPEDSRIILHDTEDMFFVDVYGNGALIAKLTELEHLSYLTVAKHADHRKLEVVIAMANSLAPRPLSAPDIDLDSLTRDKVLTALEFPELEVGSSWDPNVRQSAINDLARLFEPRNLMALHNSGSIISDELNAFDAGYVESDDSRPFEYWGDLLCAPFLDRPEMVSTLHDIFQSRWQDDISLNRPVETGVAYIESGDFAANKPNSSLDTAVVKRSEPIWFLDEPDIAIGAEGPLYYVYRAERVGPFTLVCKAQNRNALRAWLTLELHRDLPRPENVAPSDDVLTQFRAYDNVRPLGPSHYLISKEGELNSYLISQQGDVLIHDRLSWWDWDARTETITAENASQKVGLYLPDGTKLLDHLYEDIGGWEDLGPNIVRVRGKEDQYFNVEMREFVPDPRE